MGRLQAPPTRPSLPSLLPEAPRAVSHLRTLLLPFPACVSEEDGESSTPVPDIHRRRRLLLPSLNPGTCQ